MESVEYIYDWLLGLAFGLTPFSSHQLKSIFIDAGLLPVWDLLRDYVFSYKIWILGVLPCLFLQRLFPASRAAGTRRALFYDAIYPIANGILIFPFVYMFITIISNFYHQMVPSLNTGNKPLWLQMLGAFLVGDLMFYVCHWLRHKVKWLWYFHSIHHSQEHLGPLTIFRFHFGDQIARDLITTVPIAFVGGARSHGLFWSFL